jgi:CubicO group peptidase (beta-lactamase class C family)
MRRGGLPSGEDGRNPEIRCSAGSVAAMCEVSQAVERAVRSEPRLRHLQSIIVVHGGEVVAAQYFRDRREDDLSNLHSATKSVLSTLVGIAVDEGALELTTTVGEVWRGRVSGATARITVAHLLTMTSGLAADGSYDIDAIADAGGSWVEGVLGAPLHGAPGTAFAYNNGATHVLGAMVATATERSLARFAEERLFAPLGILAYRWPRDPEGNALGYGHLELRPRDLARLGELYLAGGSIEGLRVVDAAYVEAATKPASPGGPPEDVPYGYLWWVAPRGARHAYFAAGFGGQSLTVVPELELVVATTADVAVLTPASARVWCLIDDVVIPSLS